MQSTLHRSGDVEIIRLAGDFDGGKDCVRSTQQFKEMLDRGVRKIVLDFKLVRWINSNGVGCLIAGKRMADAAGARMALCSLNRRSLSVLYTMRLEEVIDCEPDLEAALNAVSGGGTQATTGNDRAREIYGEQDFRDQI
jgi:anti-anti-sigma factor